MHTLTASHISKSYKTAGGSVEVLKDISLQISQGEIVAVMGPSGSGKTTLLHILTGIDVPDRGEVTVEGTDLTELTKEETALFRRKYMGMIFQDFQLLESLTVKENLLLPLILDKRTEDEQQESLEKLLQMLDIVQLADKGITEISGGQKQRVAIGRALIHQPQIVFGDEPTGSLDIRTTAEVMKCMVEMNKKSHASFLLVTHDAYAASFCDRVLLLRDGKLAGEVRKRHSKREYEEDIMRLLYFPGGEEDDVL